MSESPEEQPSTGVLGRIGSWFSPWRSKNPKSPSETSPTSEQAGKSEGEGESGESARPQARERQSEEEEQSSNPSLPCNILPCEEEDATQSAHRDSLSLCSPETAGGAPAGEEFAGSRKKRIGQGKEREESSNVISESGNPEKNASHLTHLSSSSEQGVVWDAAHTQQQAQERAQAQTGRRLRVYVEETSVFQGGQDTCAGQQVFQTKVTKSLEVPCKSSSSLDSPAVTSSTSEEKKRINVRHFVGTESNYSGFEGVSLKSSNNLQFESAKEQTEGDSMGRKNAARRKSRKNAQGDGGTSPHEKMPPKYEPVLEGIPTSDNSVTSPESKSPKTLKGESSLNSSSKHSSTFQASPEQVQRKTSCPARVKQLDEFQGSNSVFAHSLECAVYGPTDMEGDDSLYRVERKTETPESKRRSLKISRSEVKLFTKNLHLKPKQTPEGENREVNAKDLTEDNKPKTETDSRPRDLKTINYERKPAAGRIADKISLFEGTAGEFNKQTLQTPRSADVSPVRKAKDRLKADFLLPEQRSRSADRYDKARSSSASPTRERLTTIRERMKNFTEQSGRQDRRAPPLKTAMRGMSQESSFTSSKSPGLNSQGKLDTKEQIQSNTVSESTLKPDGRDTAALEGKISISKDQPTDSKSTEPEDQGTKPNRIETKVPDKGSDVSVELTHSISQQSKGLSRPSSRSKRRKSREPTSPTSPNSENKPDHLTSKLVTAIEQEQADDIKEIHTPDEQTLPYTEEKTFKKQLKVLDKQMDVSSTKENIDKPRSRQEPERLVSKDEPDTAASSSGTKTAIDKDLDISPQKEEKARGHSHLFTQEREQVSKDNRETEKLQPPPLEKQESPARQPKLDAGLIMQSEEKGKQKGREDNKSNTGQTKQHQRKETELMNQTESKDGEELDNADRDKTNQTEKGEDTLQQLQPSDKMITVSDGGKFMSGPEGGVGRGDDRKNTEREEKTQPVIDKRKPQTSKPEPASKFSERTSSDLPPQTQHGRQTTTTLTQSFAVCAITQTNKEAPSGTKSDKEPLNRETATNLLTDLKPRESHGTESVVIRAETQPGSVFVEKNENTPDESCLHGANDAEFSSEKTFTAAEEPIVKATNDTPVPIAEPADSVSEKKSCVKKPPLVSAYKSVWQDDGEKTSAVKAVPSEAKTSGGIIKLAPIRPHSEASKDIESSNDTTSLKAAEKMEPGPDSTASDSTASDSTASVSTVKVGVKTDEKTVHSTMNEQSPVGNGEIFLHPDLHTVKKELVDNKPSQTPKAPTSPEAKKLIPDSIQGSSLKKSLKPRGLSKDDSITQQDVPSSWLDLDFPKQKLKVSMPKLSSSGSESNLLGTSGELDDDFVERIQNLCTPFSLPPRKHHPLRPPQPPFAMPAIKEDRFEKTFDPEEFMFGLSKKKKFTLDTTPSQLAKLQNSEAKSGLKPARASLANRSILLSSLDTHSRLKDMTLDKDEEDVKEEKDDQVKMKSRLEGSCVLSSLTSSSFKGKRNGLKVLAEGTDSGEVSPVEAPQQSPPPLSQPPQPPPPSPTAPAPVKDTLAKQSAAQSNREEAQATEAVVNDSGPPIPSFNDIKLPDYLEKYLPQKPAKPVQSKQEQEQVKTEAIGNMSPPACRDETDQGVKPGLVLPEAVSPSFPGSPPATRPTFPEFKKPRAQPQKRTPKGFHKRPGKMVLFEKSPFSGQAYEIYRDVADATSLRLSPLISVKVVRGCWVLYEKPDFQGRPIALEEGGIELTNVWAETGMETEPHNNPPMLIGSIRLAVWDYSIPRIDLFTEPEGHGRVTPYNDDTIETGSFGIPLSTASIQVYSGVWLLFSDPGFQGLLSVLETGTYPFPESWGFPSPFVGSLRPLKMGAFKVENPNEVKAVVYEKPGFEGSCLEIDNDVFSFCESEGRISADAANLDSKELKSVGSLKITGGLWVGFSEPGFEGQQHILEEGEYLDCSDWGGSEQLVSLRPILSDFLSPHLRMFSERDFGERGDNIALTVPVINMDDTGYGMKTQSIDVIGGIWVVFDEPGFCGEPCILEKGLYGCPEDWGALQPRVASAMSVVLDDFENAAKFKVQLFSEPGLQGSVLTLQDSLASLQDGFSVASCKVLAGNWLAFEEQDFAGRMYVLEEGSYADLRAMGAHSSSSILSLQTVDLEFSLPSIALFERRGLRGKRVILTDGTVNPQLAGGCSRVQSVLVEGGIWVLYEGLNYRGAQILLKPGEVPDWQKRSSWLKIGSLRPLLQKQVHFRLRNRQTGLMMSVTGDLDDVKLLRIQETEETGGLEQIWSYQNGHLHCKLLEDCCLCPSGSVTMAGSRVGLTAEPDNQVHLWSITPEGFIRYTPTPDLVLEVKGGHHFDKTQVILTTFDPKKVQQQWSVEVI